MMEYFWYILASDILGSAVTTATYIRHKNIDLRRGWIMLACIIGMCTVGSFAAWRAGNVVLGGFTLILTFCIGIRFLVKPSTERAEGTEKGAALDWKGIAVSLFFGLTIGFGTGFVGSGGGMMMLVVFTAFLGMELKSAVGTSTFIMTFTALIASVSHILIHPAILLDRWPVLLLCMTVAPAASLASARFANRVDSRTVGLVTGVVLTLLGAAPTIIAGLRSADLPDLPQGTAAPSSPVQEEGTVQAEFYPGSIPQMRPLRISATVSTFVWTVPALVLMFAAAASENSIALIMASFGCIIGVVVMMIIIWPNIRLSKEAMTMMVRSGGTLWRVDFNALNIADTYRFTKKNGAVRTLRWDLLNAEEQERAKASVLRAIGVLTSGQVMPGSALSMAVMPLTDLQIDKETKWAWQGFYSGRNGRRTKVNIPKAYPGFTPGPGFEPVRAPVPARWSLVGIALALTLVFALLGGMVGRVLEGPVPKDPVVRSSAPVPSPTQTAEPSTPVIPEVDYQSMFHVGEELGYAYTAVGYIVPPAGMPGAGLGVYADVHVPYSDSPQYSPDGGALHSTAHGIDVAVTLTGTTGNAQTVVDLAYGLMGASGYDIYEEGTQDTTYIEEYDIAVKQVTYFEEDRTRVRIAILYADYKQEGYYLSAAITYYPEQFDEDYPVLLEELRDAYALNLPEIPPMDGV